MDSVPHILMVVMKMNKGGRFPYMSTRNNNFSNRNMMGAMCVADGNTGKCAAGEGCQKTMEDELLKKYKNEKADGTAKTGALLMDTTYPDNSAKIAELKAAQQRLAAEIAALEKA